MSPQEHYSEYQINCLFFSDHREITTYEQMANFRDPKEIVRPRISLTSCLEAFAATATVEDFYSTAINAKSIAKK